MKLSFRLVKLVLSCSLQHGSRGSCNQSKHQVTKHEKASQIPHANPYILNVMLHSNKMLSISIQKDLGCLWFCYRGMLAGRAIDSLHSPKCITIVLVKASWLSIWGKLIRISLSFSVVSKETWCSRMFRNQNRTSLQQSQIAHPW